MGIVNLLRQLRIPNRPGDLRLTTTGRPTRAARLASEHWPAVDVEDDDAAHEARQ